jgi:hypothetical protein
LLLSSLSRIRRALFNWKTCIWSSQLWYSIFLNIRN